LKVATEIQYLETEQHSGFVLNPKSKIPNNLMAQRIFYGWYIVAAGFVCLWISVGIGFYSFPVFFVELSENLGWGRGWTTAAISVTFIVGGLVSPIVGRLVPKYGARNVVLAGSLITSGAFVLLGLMQTLWQFYLICLALAVGLSCTGTIPTSYAVSDWFHKRRGTAMGIMMVGVGLGGLVFVPLTRKLIDAFGWRITFVIYAVFVSLVLLPSAAAVFRRRPAELGVLPDGELRGETKDPSEALVRKDIASTRYAVDWALRDAIRTRAFWVIAGAFILATFGQSPILVHQVAYFQDIGISPEKAAQALGLCAFLGIAGKLFFGAMADRFPSRYAMALCFGLQAGGTVILLCTPALGSPFWFVIIWGFAMGGIITLEPLIIAECFGIKSYGVILGTVYILTAFGGSAGAPFAGFIFDVNRSYTLAWGIFIATYAVSAGLSLLAIPPATQLRPNHAL